MTRLNLGCGSMKLAGWVNCDFDPRVRPDLVLDLNVLPFPFEDNSVDDILMDNVLEHLHVPLDKLLSEFHRILKRNGFVRIVTPNCFRWRSRLSYLVGEFRDADGWEVNHSLILKPSVLRQLARHKNFQVTPEHQVFEDLFSVEIDFRLRKREDV